MRPNSTASTLKDSSCTSRAPKGFSDTGGKFLSAQYYLSPLKMEASKSGIKLYLLVTALFILSTVALAIALGFTYKNKNDIGGDIILRPPLVPEDIEFQLPTSTLGVYSEAAVATDTRPCAQVGTKIFRLNGTAVDAAIGTLVCNAAIHSHSLGLGGGFFMTLYVKSEGQSYFLNARETAPAQAHEEMYSHNPELSQNGAMAIAVPGELKGFVEAKKRFGNPKLSLLDLFQPTIDMCNEGFKATRSLERAINQFKTKTKFDKNLREEFTNPETGEFYQMNDIIKRPKFAETLKKLGQSPDGSIFYEGEMGQQIVEELQKQGGIITMEDLKNYRAKWEEPLKFDLNNGLVFHTTPPPGSGAVTGGILKILDHLRTENDENVNSIHYRFLEASKYAFAKRSKLGDWADETIKDQVMECIDSMTNSSKWMKKVMESWNEEKTQNNAQFYGADFQYIDEDHGTSHVSILAPNGDAVSVTSTINTYFGSGIMSESTRIVFNNQMDDFSTPNTTNYYGIPASEQNFIKPNKRPASSMSPSIIVNSTTNQVQLVVGASGGPRIISAVAFVTLRHLFLQEDVKTAIDAPRFHHQLVPMLVEAEIGANKDIIKHLRSKGHKLEVKDVYFGLNYGGARVQAIAIDAKSGIITANNDRRKEGQVDGF